MKIFSLALLTAIACYAHSQTIDARFIITFKKGQTEIKKEQKSELIKIAAKLKDEENITIYPLVGSVIEASNNHIQITNRNMNLQSNLKFDRKSREQAKALAEYAKSQGFEIIGTPYNFPSAYRGLSASVDMKYHKPETVAQPQPIAKKNTPLKDRYPEKPSQFFVINPHKDTLIHGNEGTKLLFEAGCLMTQKDAVQIELKEFYGLDDYMKGDLMTVSNGKMIETGGSIYLDAKEKDNPSKTVRINPSKGVAVDFTIGKNDPKMEVFVKDPRSRQTNWVKQRVATRRTSTFKMTYTIKENGKVKEVKTFTSKEEWEKFKLEMERKAAQAKLEAEEKRKEEERQRKEYEAALAKKQMIDSKLRVNNLGFINCDRFPDEPLMPLMVFNETTDPAEYYLVFKDVRGVMKGYADGKKITFGRVPKGKEAVLIAVAFIDDQAYFYKNTLTPGSGRTPKIQMKAVEEKFVDQQLAMLK